jgi:predicted small lipoprotein YifL
VKNLTLRGFHTCRTCFETLQSVIPAQTRLRSTSTETVAWIPACVGITQWVCNIFSAIKPTKLTAAITLLALLTACGQKGPLVLPATPSASAAASAPKTP